MLRLKRGEDTDHQAPAREAHGAQNGHAFAPFDDSDENDYRRIEGGNQVKITPNSQVLVSKRSSHWYN